MRRASLLVLCLAVCTFAVAQSHEHAEHHHDAGEQLGTVSFPISCSPDVQKPFERGIALLHSFWYEEAEQQFRDVAAADPKCAIAHFGIALSLWHQLWDRPNPDTLAKGKSEMKLARSLHASTDRERGYIAALSAFYEPKPKTDYKLRAKAYSAAMQKVYEKNPQDVEAGAFYALSLLSSASGHEESTAHRKQAVAILNRLFEQQPNHPGLAHYIIHSCDTPEMAPLALEAARRYARIAPSSSHAVHMPAHIFARLGLWQEDIDSNLASVELTRKLNGMGEADNRLHAMDFLNYAYLQVGNDAAAHALMGEIEQLRNEHKPAMNSEMRHNLDASEAEFAVVYDLETRRFADLAAYQLPADASPMIRLIVFEGRAIANGYLRDAKGAAAAVQQFEVAVADGLKSEAPYMFKDVQSDRDTLHAWLAFASGDSDNAVRLMRKVAEQEDRGEEGGGPPASEMLADMLLELKQPSEALAAYESSLKRHPNRFDSLEGAARAAEQAGDTAKSAQYYAQLLKNCAGSDSDRVAQIRAKATLASNSTN